MALKSLMARVEVIIPLGLSTGISTCLIMAYSVTRFVMIKHIKNILTSPEPGPFRLGMGNLEKSTWK